MDDDFLDLGPPPKHTDPRTERRRRMVLRTVGGAIVVAYVLHSNDNRRVAPKVATSGSASQSTRPVPQPSFGTVTPVAPSPLAGPLDARLCPAGHTCTNPPTRATVRAGIYTALQKVYGPVSDVRIRNAVASGSDRLFAREVAARTRFGRLDVRAASVKPNTGIPSVQDVGERVVGLNVQFYGYTVTGTLAVPKNYDDQKVLNQLGALLYDPRLLAAP